MANKSEIEMEPYRRAFFLRQFDSLCAKLYRYRIDPELYEARKSVLSFVIGLRFSALLIYTIRSLLGNTEFTANWGVIIDESGEKRCSPECDIIIHKDGSEDAWNGDDDVNGSVMDFRFVDRRNVKLVVSCKGFEVTQIDQNMKSDIVKLGDYVENVWLFAECCNTKQVTKLQQDAGDAGYKNFYYLYLLKESQITPDFDERVWLDFTESLLSLVAG